MKFGVNKCIFFMITNFILIGMTLSINTCGTIGDMSPQNATQCTNDKLLTDGGKCCYISAKINSTTLISACAILPKGAGESVIEATAKSLGENSTYSCDSIFVKFLNGNNFILIVIMFMFVFL
jgi:hypothetical protein